MTKADKMNAVVALAMIPILALISHHMRSNRIGFVFGFPAIMWLLWWWMNRARTASFLTKHSEEEVIFERPVVLRSLFGFFGVFLAILLVEAIQRGMYDEVLYVQSTGVPSSLSENIMLFLFLAIFIGLPSFGFLWLAGFYQIRFDLNQRRCYFRQGLPLIARTVCSATDGGVFGIYDSGKGRYALRFRLAGHKYGYFLGFYATDEQARTEAHLLADKMGLAVERRDTNQKRIRAI